MKATFSPFGGLSLARKVNLSDNVENVVLIVLAPTPTESVNLKLRSYHWIKYNNDDSSLYSVFPVVSSLIDFAQDNKCRAIICAQDKAIAFALSKLALISQSNYNQPLSSILAGHPKLTECLPREFRIELSIYYGWIRDDAYYTEIHDKCYDAEAGCYSRSLLTKLSYATLHELETKASFSKV